MIGRKTSGGGVFDRKPRDLFGKTDGVFQDKGGAASEAFDEDSEDQVVDDQDRRSRNQDRANKLSGPSCSFMKRGAANPAQEKEENVDDDPLE